MRDPAQIFTKKGTPIIAVVCRVLFGVYFIVALGSLFYPVFPHSELTFAWVLYLFTLYIIAERFYKLMLERKIDMTFALPLMLAVYILNLFSNLLGGQEEFALLNRIEYFATFVLLAFVVSIFFLEYLPLSVSRDHPYYTALLTLSVTGFFGVANEIIELLFDALLGTQHVGEGFDTSLDLLMNTMGSGLLIAVRLIARDRFRQS